MKQSQAQEHLLETSSVLKWNRRWLAVWVLALAAAVRAIVSSRTDPVAFDSAIYFEMAQFIRAGAWEKVLSYPFPPLFPLLVASLEGVGVPTEAAGLLLSFGLNLCVLLPLFFVARDLAGPRAALGAIFLWAVHPYAVRLSVRALSDTPTLFFVALALSVGLYALKQKKMSYALLAGMLSGCAYLARPEGIEAALGLAALFGIFLPPAQASSGLGRRALLRAAWISAPLLGWALIASPYVAYISAQAGSLTLSKKKSVQAMVSSVAVTAPKGDGVLSPPAAKNPPETPAVAAKPSSGEQPGWLRRVARSIYIFQQPLVNGVYPVVLLLALWGMIEIHSGRMPVDQPTLFLLLGLAGLHFMILVGVAADQGSEYLGGHHFFLLVLYLTPFAGAGLIAAIDWTRARFPQLRWAPAVVVIVCAVLIMPAALRWRDFHGAAMRAAGIWVRGRLTPGGMIVSNNAKFAFHAGVRRMPLPEGSKAAIDLARQRGAGFVGLYSDSRQAHELQALISSGDVELAAEFPERREARFQVYRVMPHKAVTAAP